MPIFLNYIVNFLKRRSTLVLSLCILWCVCLGLVLLGFGVFLIKLFHTAILGYIFSLAQQIKHFPLQTNGFSRFTLSVKKTHTVMIEAAYTTRMGAASNIATILTFCNEGIAEIEENFCFCKSAPRGGDRTVARKISAKSLHNKYLYRYMYVYCTFFSSFHVLFTSAQLWLVL